MVLNGECMLVNWPLAAVLHLPRQFSDDYIVAGAQGGYRAGEALLSFASRYARETLPNVFKTPRVKLLATYCVSSASLADTALSAGLIHSASTIGDFMIGMNEYAHAQVDAVDLRNEAVIAEKMIGRSIPDEQ
jgi:hypothetical protein